MRLTVDGEVIEIDADPEMPLLWALRDLQASWAEIRLRHSRVRRCTVHIMGEAVRSRLLAVGDVKSETTTIEGLSKDGTLHPVQQAWLEEQVAQCGYSPGRTDHERGGAARRGC